MNAFSLPVICPYLLKAATQTAESREFSEDIAAHVWSYIFAHSIKPCVYCIATFELKHCVGAVRSVNDACFTWDPSTEDAFLITSLTAVIVFGKAFVCICVCVFTFVIRLLVSGKSPRANLHPLIVSGYLCASPPASPYLCACVMFIPCKDKSCWISKRSVSFSYLSPPHLFLPFSLTFFKICISVFFSVFHNPKAQMSLDICCLTTSPCIVQLKHVRRWVGRRTGGNSQTPAETFTQHRAILPPYFQCMFGTRNWHRSYFQDNKEKIHLCVKCFVFPLIFVASCQTTHFHLDDSLKRLKKETIRKKRVSKEPIRLLKLQL